MKSAVFNVLAAVLVVGGIAAAHGATIGNEGFTVPPLACFGDAPKHVYDLPTVVSDLSGATYDPETGNVFMVNNGDATVFEVKLGAGSGTVVGKWKLNVADPESISAMGSRKFAFTNENPSGVYHATLPAQTSVPAVATAVTGTKVFEGLATKGFPAAKENLGFEGVTWISKAKKFYTVQEMNPLNIYEISEDGATVTKKVDLMNAATPKLMTAGALTRGGDAEDEVFVIIKEPANYIHRINLATGKSTEQYAGALCDMGQPEGLTFWKDSAGVVNMLVVGEPHQVRHFQADKTCVKAVNATTGLTAKCPEKITASIACDKTVAEGGCPYKRCDKKTTAHIKICTDDSKATQCTRTECQAHCEKSTNFDGTDWFAGVTGTEKCTHWAYDVKESECYIFSGCKNIAFDEDYVQYSLKDNFCEKTLEEGGCKKRRCSKTGTVNRNEKVCTDSSEEKKCTLAQCKTKCASYTNFTCTSYAHSAKGECYVFETCNEEGDEDDYDLYVMRDPTCDEMSKNMSDAGTGGCNQRRCSKSPTDNKNEKVCSGTSTTLKTCTATECRTKCADHTAFNCEIFAYDKTDKDCYVFETCNKEGFSDDYDLFTLPYAQKLLVKSKNAACAKERAAGGCPLRRCSKSNANKKICEKGSSTNPACSLDKCEAHCYNATDLKQCTHYAFDKVAGDCYVFEDCVDEGDETDYDLYRLSPEAPQTVSAPVSASSAPRAVVVSIVFAAMMALFFA